MTDGFLGRWSRRKQGVRAGLPVDEPAAPLRPSPGVSPPPMPVPARPDPRSPDEAVAQHSATAVPQEPTQEVRPTLEDAQALTPASDFRRFVAPDVDPQVRNAAVKQLFTDPHFNVMDGLDIYIDDYTQPDPLPLGMLNQMASAQFLQLVMPTTPDAPSGASAEGASPSPASQAPTVARMPQPAGPQPTSDHHADTDLRLQQDHAHGAPSAGRRAG